MTSFVIPVRPHPWQRARLANGRHFTDDKTRAYKAMIAAYGRISFPGVPLSGPVEVRVSAIYAAPASWSRRKREDALNDRVRPTGRPDVDNLAKGVMDALNGIAYADDSQIVRLTASKHYGHSDSVVVMVVALDAATQELAA
jgi:Holliday junction resolvase RusA-like endonuclease